MTSLTMQSCGTQADYYKMSKEWQESIINGLPKKDGRRKGKKAQYGSECDRIPALGRVYLTTGRVIYLDPESLSMVRYCQLSLTNSGYVQWYDTDGHKLLHRELIGGTIPKDCEIDHWNHNRLDNRLKNLRLVTKQENMANRMMYESPEFNEVKKRDFFRPKTDTMDTVNTTETPTVVTSTDDSLRTCCECHQQKKMIPKQRKCDDCKAATKAKKGKSGPKMCKMCNEVVIPNKSNYCPACKAQKKLEKDDKTKARSSANYQKQKEKREQQKKLEDARIAKEIAESQEAAKKLSSVQMISAVRRYYDSLTDESLAEAVHTLLAGHQLTS